MSAVEFHKDNEWTIKELIRQKIERRYKKKRLLPLPGSRRRCLPYAALDDSISLHAVVQGKKGTINQSHR
jgi:hypothetical protein